MPILFARAKQGYHPITTGTVQGLIEAARANPPVAAPAATEGAQAPVVGQGASKPTVEGGLGKAPLVEDPVAPKPAPAPSK